MPFTPTADSEARRQVQQSLFVLSQLPVALAPSYHFNPFVNSSHLDYQLADIAQSSSLLLVDWSRQGHELRLVFLDEKERLKGMRKAQTLGLSLEISPPARDWLADEKLSIGRLAERRWFVPQLDPWSSAFDPDAFLKHFPTLQQLFNTFAASVEAKAAGFYNQHDYSTVPRPATRPPNRLFPQPQQQQQQRRLPAPPSTSSASSSTSRDSSGLAAALAQLRAGGASSGTKSTPAVPGGTASSASRSGARAPLGAAGSAARAPQQSVAQVPPSAPRAPTALPPPPPAPSVQSRATQTEHVPHALGAPVRPALVDRGAQTLAPPPRHLVSTLTQTEPAPPRPALVTTATQCDPPDAAAPAPPVLVDRSAQTLAPPLPHLVSTFAQTEPAPTRPALVDAATQAISHGDSTGAWSSRTSASTSAAPAPTAAPPRASGSGRHGRGMRGWADVDDGGDVRMRDEWEPSRRETKVDRAGQAGRSSGGGGGGGGSSSGGSRPGYVMRITQPIDDYHDRMRRRLKGFGDIVGLFFQSTPLRGKQWLVVRYTARQDCLDAIASVNKDDLGFATRWPDDYEHMQVLARAPSSWFNKGDVDDMLVLVEDNFGQRPIGVALSPNKTKLVLQMQSANSADEIINSRRTSLPDGRIVYFERCEPFWNFV